MSKNNKEMLDYFLEGLEESVESDIAAVSRYTKPLRNVINKIVKSAEKKGLKLDDNGSSLVMKSKDLSL